ncbi:hypothetical protein GGP91_003297 [Salinibacter ruber]|nr:hypothetical protein [Salinibacter ruber]
MNPTLDAVLPPTRDGILNLNHLSTRINGNATLVGDVIPDKRGVSIEFSLSQKNVFLTT